MPIYTKVIRVRGNLGASFVFEDQEEMDLWIETRFPSLQKQHGDIEYYTGDLDGLAIGDTCRVMGEGFDTFVITKLVVWEKYRVGFALDSGWIEEVAKCYKVPEEYTKKEKGGTSSTPKFTDDDFVCSCGNTTFMDGFYPCLRDGTVVEPVVAGDWDGVSYKCIACKFIHKNPYFNENGDAIKQTKG